MADKNFDRRDFQIERIRETTRYTAKRFRTMAEDIDRLADVEDYTKIPGELMSLILWGVANARPDSPSMQLRELVIAERADVTIAERDRETDTEIIDRISNGRSIGGYSGITENTRRIVRRAVTQAVRAARGTQCPECHQIEHHKMDCSIGRLERNPMPLPALDADKEV